MLEKKSETVQNIDFLTPGTAEIRHQIKNIIDSYSNDWDVIAELAQNSMDAIRLEKPTKGHIKLYVDANSRRITLEDNGCGINPSLLPRLLAPFASAKANSPDLIGNKGVGITFVIFSSIEFSIETHSSAGSATATIVDAWNWVSSESPERPKLVISAIDHRGENGTKITLRLPDFDSDDYQFFDFTFEQLKMVLFTRTALGDTTTIWGSQPTKDVLLTFVDKNGETFKAEIDCRYLLPTDALGKGEFISISEFADWLQGGDRTDMQKRTKLKDKLIVHSGSQHKSGRKIYFWACFVQNRKVWDIISHRLKLVDNDILQISPIERIDRYGEKEYLFHGGMYTSTRSMPTGIRSEMRTKGSGGYLPNFFIILDDPQLSFDIGRKSIPGRQIGMLRDIAADVFREFINKIKKYVSGEPPVEFDDWEKAKIFNEIRSMPELKSTKTSFMTRPHSQEASVAAIFFELIGRGHIQNFKPYLSGYRNRYDLYTQYKGADLVVEFKQDISGLVKDFDDEVKMFDQVDILVIWDVTEKDREMIAAKGFDINEMEPGIVSGNPDNNFHFLLTLAHTSPIRICCIRRLIEN